jgi:hypothetical protein
MRVPLMVKNGFKSASNTSAGSRRADSARKSRIDAKPKTAPKSQKRKKNHF